MNKSLLITIGICVLAITLAIVFQVESLRNGISQYIFETFVFAQFTRGVLCVYLPGDIIKKFGTNDFKKNDTLECDASIEITSTSFYYHMLLNAGTTGLGETYIDGEWKEHSNDNYNIHSFVYYITDNVVHTEQPFFFKLIKYLSLKEWVNYMAYLPKTLKNDQMHVDVAYSLGNDFFRQMLDDQTMTYTCAIFPSVSDDTSNDQSFANAQINKFAVVLRKLNVNSSDLNILEVGSGWGAFANYVHSKTNVNITAINIAQPQIDYSINRYIVNNDKYNGRLKYLKLDYRHMVKHFGANSMDRVAAVGFLEHAGHEEQLNEFMRLTYDILKPGGRMVVHQIARNNAFPKWKDFSNINDCCTYVTFIDQYIFPGACIILPDHVHKAADAVGFKLMHKEYYGQHYVKTLINWRRKWESPKSKEFIIRNYGTAQFRSYKFGSALSEASFRVGINDLVQMIFIKPKTSNAFQSDVHYQEEIFL